MEQWQYEVTAGGRLWYCIDDKAQTVWLTGAHVGHPKRHRVKNGGDDEGS